jgi:uncharacterized protein YqjF (DUF2071 family)
MTTSSVSLTGRPVSALRATVSEPVGSWVMHQRWHNLLFAHWRLPGDVIRRKLPKSIELDTFDGDAWISVIPFYMTGVRLRWAPPIPTAHAFAELNVRTYVRHRGVAGIWFFSLDAESTLAVIGARLGAALPYYRAAMQVRCRRRDINYCSDRVIGTTPACFDATYWPRDERQTPAPGSLEYFLTERYSLFSSSGDRIWRIDIAHPRWDLQDAVAVVRRNTMTEAAGLGAPAGDPLLHFATVQDVLFWPPVRVE